MMADVECMDPMDATSHTPVLALPGGSHAATLGQAIRENAHTLSLDADGNPTFTLPLNFKEALETFNLKVVIAEGTVQPKVTGGYLKS